MGSKKEQKGHIVLGLILIGLGLILILDRQGMLSWTILRSYGFLLLGALLFIQSLSSPHRKGLFSSVVLFCLGLYFTGVEWHLYQLQRGLTISIFVLSFGMAFYAVFIFKQHKWDCLIYGNLLILTGILFLLAFLNILPSETFITIVDDYWPLVFVILGLALIVKAFHSAHKLRTQEEISQKPAEKPLAQQ